MLRKGIWALAIVLCFAVAAAAQMPEEYLDLYIVKVKPDKHAEVNALVQKMVDANRKTGDRWLAYESVYGEADVVTFVSARQSYADIEKASAAFEAAIAKALGPAGAQKLFADLGSCTVSARGELRRRRWDLSTRVPADPAARTKQVGEARWIRTVIVRVRPGRGLEYEAWLKRIKEAVEKTPGTLGTRVSQGAAGQASGVYYITWLAKSLAEFDGGPSLMQMMGEGDFEKYQKAVAEMVISTDWTIASFAPKLSNPPDDVAAAAPDFWRPKAAAKPKAAAGAEAKPKAPAKPKQ
jgi:hypothetical protein